MDVEHSLEAVITLLAAATAKKMTDQLAEYLTGEYSSPTQDQLTAAASAPVHNMWAERTLGIVDALKKRSPNADISFMEAKVKCRQNKTLEWLQHKDSEEQARLVDFCVVHLDRVERVRTERRRRHVEVVKGRQRAKGHKIDVTERNKVTKVIQDVLRNGGQIEHPVFNQVAGDQLEKLVNIFTILDKAPIRQKKKSKSKKYHIDQLMQHMWWDNETNNDVVWFGRVVALKTRKATKDPVLRVSYWKHDQSEDDSVDSNILFAKIIADMIFMNLILF